MRIYGIGLAAAVNVIGCGSPFIGLMEPEREADAGRNDARDASGRDAPLEAPTTGDSRSGGSPDGDADPGVRPRDASSSPDAQREAGVDGDDRDDSGDGASGQDVADSSRPGATDGAAGADRVLDGDGAGRDVAWDHPTDSTDAHGDHVARGDAEADGRADGQSDVGIDRAAPDADGPICGVSPPAVGGACPASCTGGCNAGVCAISCNAEQECKQSTVVCPPDFVCEVRCAGKQSCEQAVLVCPDTYACRVACSGEQSCKGLRLNCATGTCELACQGSEQVCDDAVMNCGAQACTARCNVSSESRPTVNCGQSCDCQPCP